MAESITAQMDKILGEFIEGVQDKTNKTTKATAQETVKQLKATSPKRPGGGRYAKGWAVKDESAGQLSSFRVYNRTDYQLTHLLENGHIIRNKKGTYGRTAPIKHIEPAADEGAVTLERKLREAIE